MFEIIYKEVNRKKVFPKVSSSLRTKDWSLREKWEKRSGLALRSGKAAFKIEQMSRWATTSKEGDRWGWRRIRAGPVLPWAGDHGAWHGAGIWCTILG